VWDVETALIMQMLFHNCQKQMLTPTKPMNIILYKGVQMAEFNELPSQHLLASVCGPLKTAGFMVLWCSCNGATMPSCYFLLFHARQMACDILR
jgi:hypothetical protein